MKYLCTQETGLDDLVGLDGAGGFQYGPLTSALKLGENLELENSNALSAPMMAKIQALLHGMFIVETEETLRVRPGFKLVLH